VHGTLALPRARATRPWPPPPLRDARLHTRARQVHVPIAGDQALRVPSGANVIDVLRSMENYGTFLLALQVRAARRACVPPLLLLVV
jgi:hypothetical protein